MPFLDTGTDARWYKYRKLKTNSGRKCTLLFVAAILEKHRNPFLWFGAKKECTSFNLIFWDILMIKWSHLLQNNYSFFSKKSFTTYIHWISVFPTEAQCTKAVNIWYQCCRSPLLIHTRNIIYANKHYETKNNKKNINLLFEEKKEIICILFFTWKYSISIMNIYIYEVAAAYDLGRKYWNSL